MYLVNLKLFGPLGLGTLKTKDFYFWTKDQREHPMRFYTRLGCGKAVVQSQTCVPVKRSSSLGGVSGEAFAAPAPGGGLYGGAGLSERRGNELFPVPAPTDRAGLGGVGGPHGAAESRRASAGDPRRSSVSEVGVGRGKLGGPILRVFDFYCFAAPPGEA